MQISFNTAEITPAEAVALIGLLVMLHPSAVGDVSHTMTDAAAAFDVTTPPAPAAVFAAAPMPELPGAEGPSPEADAAVPPAPPAPVPAPPPAAPVVVAAGATLDKEGLPWDARIHATVEGGGGKITKDGKWRTKRDVPADVKAAVAAELKAALGAAPAPVPPPPAAVAPPVAVPAPPSAPVTVAPPVAPPPSVPAPVAAPVAPVAPTGDMGAFAAVMSKVTAAQAAGKISQEGVTATLGGLGLSQLRDLLTRPDLIPAFDAMLDALTA